MALPFPRDRKYPAYLAIDVKLIPLSESGENQSSPGTRLENGSQEPLAAASSRKNSDSKQFSSEVIYKHQNASATSSMVARFNGSGNFLAFHSHSASKDSHDISILSTSTVELVLSLAGHRGTVYEIDWLDDFTLASASSDCSAIVWFIHRKTYSMIRIPHLSFVYAVKFLNVRHSADCLLLASGSRDRTLRIWRISREESGEMRICDEHRDHGNFITSLAATKKAMRVYSADYSGEVLEYVRRRDADEYCYRLGRCVRLSLVFAAHFEFLSLGKSRCLPPTSAEWRFARMAIDCTLSAGGVCTWST